MTVTQNTSNLGVIGHPIEHSVSPQMHNAVLREFSNEDQDFNGWHYDKFDIKPSDLKDSLKNFYEEGYLGLNITAPHKNSVMDFLVGVDGLAEEIGAVNTLVRAKGGFWGYNTDYFGLEKAIFEELGEKFEDNIVNIIGAGGAAHAAAVLAIKSGCKEFWIGNRSQDRLDSLINDLRAKYNFEVKGYILGEGYDKLPKGGLLINSTPRGLSRDDESPVDLRKFAKRLRVYDMNYTLKEAPLIHQARSMGLAATNGLGMLVEQGARSLELWSKRKVSRKIMHRAAEVALF